MVSSNWQQLVFLPEILTVVLTLSIPASLVVAYLICIWVKSPMVNPILLSNLLSCPSISKIKYECSDNELPNYIV